VGRLWEARLAAQTVRHLRLSQLWAQARTRALRRVRSRRPFRVGSIPPQISRWRPHGEFLPPGAQSHAVADVRRGDFCFLNERRVLGWPPDWNAAGAPRLWQLNLHYFEYLWVLAYPDARALVTDWIARQPLDHTAAGWSAYATSLRLGNWCAYFWGRHARDLEEDPAFRDSLWASVFLQSEWLRRNLETHLLGNHLFENAVALALVGACFGGCAERWRALGLQLLERELREQVLPDGVHVERSPMYQLRLILGLLWLVNTGDAPLRDLVAEPLDRMLAALVDLCHPDGEIALLNDSAFGVQNRPESVLGYAERLGFPVPGPRPLFQLPHGGYFGARTAAGHYVVCDAGPIGPDYQPGHGHGDLLAFELSFRGKRVISDSGVFTYEAGPMRRYCRSTRAHNTVEIDGQDQSEFWGAFRVARRARPERVRFTTDAGGFTLCASHDGYRRLRGHPSHERRFFWDPRGALTVRDRVTGRSPVRAVSRLHLHPDCGVTAEGGPVLRVDYEEGSFTVTGPPGVNPRVSRSWYCSEFGVRQERQVLTLEASGPAVELAWKIAL